MEFAACHCSINEINVRISLSNIYIFIKYLHIHEANAGNFEPKKGTEQHKTTEQKFAYVNKIIKLAYCENFKWWK